MLHVSYSTFLRILNFYVEDDQDAANIMNSTLQLTIIPVNDAPILSFVSDPAVRSNPNPIQSGVTQMSFSYTEDDPPLNFGQDIYLRDVDGNISFAILNLTCKLMKLEFTTSVYLLKLSKYYYTENFKGATLELVIMNYFPPTSTDLLDGERDYVYADSVLLNAYGVVMEIASASQSSRIIALNATASEGVTPTAFEEVHLPYV